MNDARVTKPCNLSTCPYCPECGLSDAASFDERVAILLGEYAVVREGLWHEGPILVDRLCVAFGGLRAAARECGFSPTYLSQVRHSSTILSPEGYLRLTETLKQRTALTKQD